MCEEYKYLVLVLGELLVLLAVVYVALDVIVDEHKAVDIYYHLFSAVLAISLIVGGYWVVLQ